MMSTVKFHQCRSTEVKRNIEGKIIGIQGKYIDAISKNILYMKQKSSMEKMAIHGRLGMESYVKIHQRRYYLLETPIFLIDFQSNFRFTELSRDFPYNPLTTATHTVSSIINILYHGGTFVTQEPAMTHHYKLMPTVYISDHSWCTFSRFEQMYSDIYPPLQFHTEEIHCPQNPLWSICLSLPTTLGSY